MANPNNNFAPHEVGFYLQRVGSNKNEIIPLREGVHRVGRSSKADVVIRSRFCNRNLCRIIVTAQTVTVEIEGLRTIGGIWVNEKRLLSGKLQLCTADTIGFGNPATDTADYMEWHGEQFHAYRLKNGIVPNGEPVEFQWMPKAVMTLLPNNENVKTSAEPATPPKQLPHAKPLLPTRLYSSPDSSVDSSNSVLLGKRASPVPQLATTDTQTSESPTSPKRLSLATFVGRSISYSDSVNSVLLGKRASPVPQLATTDTQTSESPTPPKRLSLATFGGRSISYSDSVNSVPSVNPVSEMPSVSTTNPLTPIETPKRPPPPPPPEQPLPSSRAIVSSNSVDPVHPVNLLTPRPSMPLERSAQEPPLSPLRPMASPDSSELPGPEQDADHVPQPFRPPTPPKRQSQEERVLAGMSRPPRFSSGKRVTFNEVVFYRLFDLNEPTDVFVEF